MIHWAIALLGVFISFIVGIIVVILNRGPDSRVIEQWRRENQKLKKEIESLKTCLEIANQRLEQVKEIASNIHPVQRVIIKEWDETIGEWRTKNQDYKK